MTTLAHLIRYESPHSGLAFRESLYGPGDDDKVVADCLALANADLNGRRFLILGVDADGAEPRELTGVDRNELASFRRRFKRLIARCIEPELPATVRAVELDGCLIGYVRIEQCDSPPYLASCSLGKKLQAGQGYVRRGARNYPLRRADLQRMFTGARTPAEAPPEKAVEAPPENTLEAPPQVVVAFAGDEPAASLTLPPLSVSKLPSELAAERLKGMLEMHDRSRERLGQTESRLTRLMHTKLYGAEVPFQKHSDDSLVSALKNVDIDYSAADAHYLYEVRAHRMNLIIRNESDVTLHDVVLNVTMPRVEGTGIADRVYAEDLPDERASAGYPQISSGTRTISVAAALDALYPGQRALAFAEPVRFWARPEAEGKAVPLDFELVAEELTAPIKGSLIVYIENASTRKP
ncbi:MAG: ATP-binding protein [Gammaproteobacteria bacterium]|jgi:hypothetical protein